MIRIIAGKHKNRIIPTLKSASYRPSSSRFKEAMFSILQSGDFDYNYISNCHILDLFSGTGNLAFEGLSRGAKSITLVDINPEYLELARKFALQINEENRFNILNMNAMSLPRAKKSFDLIFIDPPYYKDIVTKTIINLIERKWVHSGSTLVIETSKSEDLKSPDGMELLIERIYGNSKLIITKVL